MHDLGTLHSISRSGNSSIENNMTIVTQLVLENCLTFDKLYLEIKQTILTWSWFLVEKWSI